MAKVIVNALCRTLRTEIGSQHFRAQMASSSQIKKKQSHFRFSETFYISSLKRFSTSAKVRTKTMQEMSRQSEFCADETCG